MYSPTWSDGTKQLIVSTNLYDIENNIIGAWDKMRGAERLKCVIKMATEIYNSTFMYNQHHIIGYHEPFYFQFGDINNLDFPGEGATMMYITQARVKNPPATILGGRGIGKITNFGFNYDLSAGTPRPEKIIKGYIEINVPVVCDSIILDTEGYLFMNSVEQVLHEFGHVAGIPHLKGIPSTNEAIMNPGTCAIKCMKYTTRDTDYFAKMPIMTDHLIWGK